MFEALLSVVKLAGSSLQWAMQLGDERRKNFASLCDRINANLESFATANDDERQSRNLCAELRVYVPEIETMAKGVLEANQLDRMALELKRVCDAWEAHSENVGGEAHRDGDDLDEVQDAAGHFRGLATLVRAM